MLRLLKGNCIIEINVSVRTGIGIRSAQINLAFFTKELHLTHRPAMNKKSQPTVIIVGRDKTNKSKLGVDFVLPSFFWVKDAVERAQKNILSYNKISVPTVTIEDLIISKLSAGRRKDLDDIEMIILAGHKIDLIYLTTKISKWKLVVPKDIKQLLKSSARL